MPVLKKILALQALTILIVRDDLLGFSNKKIPSTLNWKIQSENNSMINTPSNIWNLYGRISI